MEEPILLYLKENTPRQNILEYCQKVSDLTESKKITYERLGEKLDRGPRTIERWALIGRLSEEVKNFIHKNSSKLTLTDLTRMVQSKKHDSDEKKIGHLKNLIANKAAQPLLHLVKEDIPTIPVADQSQTKQVKTQPKLFKNYYFLKNTGLVLTVIAMLVLLISKTYTSYMLENETVIYAILQGIAVELLAIILLLIVGGTRYHKNIIGKLLLLSIVAYSTWMALFPVFSDFYPKYLKTIQTQHTIEQKKIDIENTRKHLEYTNSRGWMTMTENHRRSLNSQLSQLQKMEELKNSSASLPNLIANGVNRAGLRLLLFFSILYIIHHLIHSFQTFQKSD